LGAVGFVLSALFYGGLGLVATGIGEWLWNWPPRLPDQGEWQVVGTGALSVLAPYLVAFVAYQHNAWALLQVTTYVGLPAVCVLALGYLVLFWTRRVPWAVVWGVESASDGSAESEPGTTDRADRTSTVLTLPGVAKYPPVLACSAGPRC
jgi:hypothetical protein